MIDFPKMMTVLLEPTAACNIRCKHCYHAKTEYDSEIMSTETLNKFLSVLIPFYDKIKIIWHGGEPLLAGYDFFVNAYEEFNELSKKYKSNIDFSIQSNGTLFSEEWVDLFIKTNTSISLSFDGLYNNCLRQRTADVLDTINLLKAKNKKFSCLSVISKVNCDKMLELYNYFKRLNVGVKFNPIVPDGAGQKCDYLITKEEWVENFIKLFEFWFYDRNCNIKFSSGCDILAKYLGLVHSGCLCGSCLFTYLAVDAYGNLYPCGRLIDNNYRLGNVYGINDIRQIFLSDIYGDILKKNQLRAKQCSKCKWFAKCHSGCNASASLTGDISNKSEFDCYFTTHMFDYLENLLSNYNKNNVNKYALEIIIKSEINI